MLIRCLQAANPANAYLTSLHPSAGRGTRACRARFGPPRDTAADILARGGGYSQANAHAMRQQKSKQEREGGGEAAPA